MTEQFIKEQDDQLANSQNQQQQNSDQSLSNEGSVDTHSPEYQLQKMQQRLADKDEFISTLKEENQSTREMVAQMQERMQNMETIQEVLNKGKEQAAQAQDTGLDEDALVGKVIENLSKREQEQKMESNYNTVVENLKEQYGSHVNDKVQAAAAANGLSVSYMLDTAKRSPQAFYKLMGLEGTKQTSYQQPTRGTVQAPQENNERDLAYYSRLMRENPREYWKADTQREFRKLFVKS